MNTLTEIGTLILSVALVVLIAIQPRGQAGIGSAVFGGSGAGMPFMQRRGIEKLIYYVTWGIAIGLLLISVLKVWF